MNENYKSPGEDPISKKDNSAGLDQSQVMITDEEYEEISVYLKKLGLSIKKNYLVLTSKEHYFYSEEDLRTIKTLINLKRLNSIRNPDRFLHNLFRILPSDANFIGCFTDSDLHKKNGIFPDKTSALLNWFINFLENKPERRLNKKEVHELLETHGFRIVDMTDIDDLTFFWSRNARKQQASA